LSARRLDETSSSLLLDDADVVAEDPMAEEREDGEVSAEAEPLESRNRCRFFAAAAASSTAIYQRPPNRCEA
jgi:hypothetical protein